MTLVLENADVVSAVHMPSMIDALERAMAIDARGGVASVPRMFDLLQRPDGYDAAMDLYWQVHPARQANMRLMGAISGTSVVHRMLWKYQGWINGFNGGPIRSALSGRVSDEQMRSFRAAVEACGLPVPAESDHAFFVGRNPE